MTSSLLSFFMQPLNNIRDVYLISMYISWCTIVYITWKYEDTGQPMGRVVIILLHTNLILIIANLTRPILVQWYKENYKTAIN